VGTRYLYIVKETENKIRQPILGQVTLRLVNEN